MASFAVRLRQIALPNLRRLSTMSESPILYRVLDSKTHAWAKFAVLSMNRPKARNALSSATIGHLTTLLHEVSSDSSIRGIILDSSTDGMFCAGADLVERRTMGPDQVSQFLTDMRAAFSRLSTISVPTISVIDGHALGGGLELALCTDLRIMGPRAKVALPETGLGIIPGAGGTQRLTRLIGASKTRDLIYSARMLGGREAVDYGIGNYYEDKPMEKALELMESYVQNSPLGIAQAKKAIEYATIEHDIERGLDRERALYDGCMRGPDRDEGLLAFKEKRKPVYGAPRSSGLIKSKL